VAALSVHPRRRVSDEIFWDCHFVVTAKGRYQKDIVKGASQLAEAIGLLTHLSPNFSLTLQALFAYRNKMFHLGFEWPIPERDKFQKRLKDWPHWFTTATTNNKPWIFYLTDTFILHCIESIDNLLGGLGAFARPKRWHI